ncbi:MAG: DUF4340 domain-containing protein [Kiritimatiellae bacterium]|nr:DUF4340 domain-containing protein [Kiritimatiellia bacterium]
MNAFKKVFLYVVASMLLIAANIFLLNKPSPENIAQYPFEEDILNASKVSIIKDSSEVTLVYDGVWNIEEPFFQLVDEAVVSKLLDAISFARVHDVLTEKELALAGRSLMDFGLDKPLFEFRISSKTRPTKSLYFGSRTPTGDGVYVMVRSENRSALDGVFVLPSSVGEALFIDVDDLRRRQFVQLEPAEVSSIDIRRGSEFIRLRRVVDRWRMVAPNDMPANEAQVKSFLTNISIAKSASFVWPSLISSVSSRELSDALLSTYSLDAENAITVTLKNTSGEVMQILYGKDSSEDMVYAFSPFSRSIVCVSKALKTDALSDVSFFADDRLFPSKMPDITSIRLLDSTDTTLLSKTPTGWRIESPISAPANEQAIEQLLDRLSLLKSVDAALKGIVVTLSDGVSATVNHQALLGSAGLANLRSPLIFSLSPKSVTRIIVQNSELGSLDTVIFNPGRAAWENADGKDGRMVAQDAINSLLSQTQSLVAEHVVCLKVTDADVRRYGLEIPYLSIALDRSEEEGPRINLLLGEKTSSGGRYATLGAIEAIFTLSKSVVDNLEKSILEASVK